MIVFSIIAYILLVVWFFMGNEKSGRLSTAIGTVLSSFFAYWFWDVNNIAMIIYIVIGLVCVLFHWVSIDSKKETVVQKRKNKILAGFLALLLGGYGVHRFYLQKSTSGLLYVLFSWSMVPGILALIEAIRFFAMKEAKFDELYNKNVATEIIEPANEKVGCEEGRTSWDNPNAEFEDEDDYEPVSSNERDGDNLNYRNIRVCGYRAEAVGTIDNFSVVVKANGTTYTFKAKDGDICSYRSSYMRGTKHYEVS